MENEEPRFGFVFRGEDPRQDWRSAAVVDGFALPRVLVAELHRDREIVEVTIATETRKMVRATVPAIKVKDVKVTPRGSTGLDGIVLERIGPELDGIVRHALVGYLGTFAQDDRVLSRQLKRPIEGRVGWFEWNDDAVDELWSLIIAAMYPAKDRESAAAYVLRLWEDLYEPAGKRQRQLADDLGLKLDSVYVYLANARKARSDAHRAEFRARKKGVKK